MRIAKVITAICLTVSAFWGSYALASEDAVPLFEKLLKRATSATNAGADVYLNMHQNQWAKRRYSVSDVAFDVKKTDSLVSPIIGIARFSLVTDQTSLYATKAEADAATELDPKFSTPYNVSLTYVFKGGKWSFSKGTYEALVPFMRGKLFELSEDKIRAEPMATPNAALMHWLPR